MIYICDDKRHLVCLPYSRKNLHEVAKELNIGKHWFHKDHYDIPKRRVEEIMSHKKCVILSSKDIVRIINGTYRIKI